ncbi:MAG TPA: replicative DNA helicase [Desulfobacteraceae bacterium]|nr:replicative DNA helicase [Desulfobacteraceae bacterium]
MNSLLDRVPPHNSDVEESTLSALLINNAGFEDLDGLSPDDFYRGQNKEIFRAMLALRKKKQPVDLVTVGNELQSTEKLEQIGGPAYLVKISDEAPVALNVGRYAEIIRNLAMVRNTIQVATGIAEAGFITTDAEDYIGKAQADILSIQTTTSKDKFHSLGDLMLAAVERIEAAQKQETELGLKLGMPTLDNFIQVFGSKLMILAGRPGMGKTALALSIAKHLAWQRVKVGFLSIEMDKESLADRILSGESNINAMCFYAKDTIKGRLWQDITDAASALHDLPLYVDDAECKIQDVERKCRKLKRMGCQMIFIDQLSKIKGQAGQSKFDQYSDNCSAIALLKKELRIPIMLLCQLNRNTETRQDKRPEMADLKQTGMIEEDADMVFLLYRPGYYNENIHQANTEIILAKNRQGAKGVEQQVFFNDKRGMFQMVP